VRGRRVELLVNTIKESGAGNVRTVRADARGGLPFRAAFDLVLLDAPCSGLGTLRRDPDIRWRRQPADLESLADAQVEMLSEAARVVRPGGRLVYSTCSSEPEENELVVERFLRAHPGFLPAPGDLLAPEVRPFVGDDGYFRTLPFRDRLEAFFAAMLVKTKELQ
jgi:16S rRNA (cytosine967-C5)-methyltransferase